MKSIHNLLGIFVLILNASFVFAQGVAINENGDPAHSSAMLDVQAANKGVLIPRVNITNLNTEDPISSPETGLLVFNSYGTTGTGFYYWDDGKWRRLLGDSDAWRLTGNTGTNPTDNFLGTTDNEIFDIRTNSERAVRILADNTSGGLSDNGRVDVLNRLRIGKDGDSGNTLSGSLLVGYGAPDIYTGGISLYSNMTTEDHSFQGGIRMHNATTGTSDRGALISLKGSNLSIASIGDNIDDNILFENPNGTERMRIANNGNIGIGTTNPEEKLHISSENETGIDWNLVVQNTNNSASTGYGTGIKLKNSTFGGSETNKWFGIAAVAGTEWSNRTDLVFYSHDVPVWNGSEWVYDAQLERMRITGYGNIVVDGRISVNSGTNPTFAIELPNLASDGTGRGRAHTWTTHSDTRIKSDRKEIAYGIKDILKIEPLSYFQHNSKNTEDGRLIIHDEGEFTFGLIAQDLYQIIPEVVSKPESGNPDELWGIDYSKLTPVLVKAIQEQQQIIESQNNDIDELKNEIKQLREEFQNFINEK